MSKLLATLIFSSVAVAADWSPEHAFSSWKTQSFKGQTHYRLADVQGRQAVCGRADGTASALYFALDSAISADSVIRWSWFVETPLQISNEQSKQTDDYAARIYVVFDSGWTKLRAKALNYVWTSGLSTGSRWDNPYAGRVKMISVADANSPTGQWVSFERPIGQEILQHFGELPKTLDGIAIMVDGDNTGQAAASCVAQISITG